MPSLCLLLLALVCCNTLRRGRLAMGWPHEWSIYKPEKSKQRLRPAQLMRYPDRPSVLVRTRDREVWSGYLLWTQGSTLGLGVPLKTYDFRKMGEAVKYAQNGAKPVCQRGKRELLEIDEITLLNVAEIIHTEIR